MWKYAEQMTLTMTCASNDKYCQRWHPNFDSTPRNGYQKSNYQYSQRNI